MVMEKEPRKYAKIWGSIIDPGTLKQFEDVIAQERTLGAVLMPDAHLGYTMPIGGVALVRDAVYPSWVGYDIGCGVCAVKVSSEDFHKDWVTDASRYIHQQIVTAVPRDKHKMCQGSIPNARSLSSVGQSMLSQRKAYAQLGTLGSGNHFIEVCYDAGSEDLWIVIHSGSRGVGHGIAGHWMSVAAGGLKTNGMDCFLMGSSNYDSYMADQRWCIEYALENRKVMLRNIEAQLGIALDWESLINKVHNEALPFGDSGILHRKGATDASLDELGVIPGNMRDGSIIVRGLGDIRSYNSCSHGAGRELGRGAAKRTLSLETFKEQMVGIACKADEGHLDEAPEAYKDFSAVMFAQRDLCEIVRVLKPIVNVKG